MKNRFVQSMVYLFLVIAADTILSLVLQLIGWALGWFHITWVTVVVGGLIIFAFEFIMLMIGFYFALGEDYDDWNEPYDRY